MNTSWNNVFFGWFPQIDYLFACAATVVVIEVVSRAGLEGSLYDYLGANGTAIYGAVLSAFAALLGFAVAVLAIVYAIISSTNPKRLMASEKNYDAFWSAFTLTIRTLGICTCASFAALFFTASPHFRIWTFLVFCFIVGFTLPGVIRAALTLEVLVKGVRDASKAK